MDDKKVSILNHIEELRSRLIKCVVFTVCCAVILYSYSNRIIGMISRPIGGKLVFIEPQEAFITHVKIALWGGLFTASPFIIFQIWRFIATGLNPNERKYIYYFAPVSFSLFVFGAAFGFFFIIPMGLKLLLSYGGEYMEPMITISKYTSFISTLTLAFGVVFQLPLALLFLTRLGLVTPKSLSQKRRFAVVLIFIAAAILTPPDVISQICMALPLLILYEIGIIFSKIAYKSTYKSID